MAEEKGAVTHDIVDVFVAVHIPFAAALRMVNENGKRSRVADVVGYAGRKGAKRLLVELL